MATPKPTFAELQRELGAEMRPLALTPAVSDTPSTIALRYGPEGVETLRREHDALRQGCGLVDLSWLSHLEVRGEDRLRFVNGQITCDLKELQPGDGTYGFFTSAKGRINADAVFLAREDSLRILLPPERAPFIREHLEKYIIVDRVEVHSREDLLPLALIGPRAAEALEAHDVDLPTAPWGHVEASVAGVEVQVQRHEALGAEAWLLWVESSTAPALVQELLATTVTEVIPVGLEALETLRIEAGIPRFGQDFGPDSFPQETGLSEAVSFTKGCYLGQEVVARLHYRGQVSRQLRGVRFEGEEAPAAGTELVLDERSAGVVSSAVVSPTFGAPIGLATLQRRAFEAGTILEVGSPNGGSARVEELPRIREGAD